MVALTLDAHLPFPYPGAVVCSKYRLVRELGSGGMGTVWLARNEALGKDVAVKLLRPDATAPDAGERFIREARAAASIDHPAIVSVFDYGQSETGAPFIVMERLEGESLAALIERKSVLSAVEAVRHLLPIVDGLAAAHAQGVVHRDLKPENVFLALEGGRLQPKVLDFGVAKLQERENDLHLTRVGMVVGSPFYMAPEQARGLGDVDHRCDIWAICIMLYELVSGETPYMAENYNAAIAAVIEKDLPPFLEVPEESGLWDVVSVGLRKDRESRYQSMRELGDALAGYLVRHGVYDDVRGIPLAASWRTAGASSAPPASGARPSAHERPSSTAGAWTTVSAVPPPKRRPLTWFAASAAALALLAGVGLRSSQGTAGAAEIAPRAAAAVHAPPPVTSAPAEAPADRGERDAARRPPAAVDAAKDAAAGAPPGAKTEATARAPSPQPAKRRPAPPRLLDLKNPY